MRFGVRYLEWMMEERREGRGRRGKGVEVLTAVGRIV